jgi:hypothetical protein
MVHHVRQVGEEARELVGVIEVEGRDARSELEADSMQPVRVAGRQDHVGSRLTRAPAVSSPIPDVPPSTTTVWPTSCRSSGSRSLT